MRISKKKRQSQLIQTFQDDPFITDEEMAKKCSVSIQTIRLDRMELGIPEYRERIKRMAEDNFDHVRSLSPEEVVGEVIDLQLDQHGISILEIKEEHVFARNPIARGHYLFAQANSLAVEIINAEVVLTRSANIRFIRPVHVEERCIAYANVVKSEHSRIQIQVKTKVNKEIVFQGTFHVYRLEAEEQT